uniref:Uncharacterized protein n=1 Tax=Arundo donax TaxID=35708 RepID=A0A0A9G5A7_ARUDO
MYTSDYPTIVRMFIGGIFLESTNDSCAHRIIRQVSEYRRSIFIVSK